MPHSCEIFFPQLRDSIPDLLGDTWKIHSNSLVLISDSHNSKISIKWQSSLQSLRSQSLTSTLVLGFLGNISVKTEEVNWKILKLFMNMLTICLFGKRNNYESRVRQHKVIWLSLQVQWVVSNGIIDILAVNHRACLNSFFPILCVAYSYLGRTNWCSRHFQNRILSLTISTWFLRFCIYCYFSRILNRWVVVIEWENCETLYGQFSYNVWQVTKLSGSCDCI